MYFFERIKKIQKKNEQPNDGISNSNQIRLLNDLYIYLYVLARCYRFIFFLDIYISKTYGYVMVVQVSKIFFVHTHTHDLINTDDDDFDC